ncbi:neither inactivation nor afterpotential B isoform X2 [Rhodnius prolixus]|uniref:neither inactivation nor afterpotential B isoform X2 n=1 Tax=Rhodnius prolixus TaxID=13249 RepID=UPI003D18B15D
MKSEALLLGYGHQTVRDEEDKCEKLIAKEIDSVSGAKEKEAVHRLSLGKNVLPHCDLSVWLRDCKDEVIYPIEGHNTGYIPTWLKGSLIRNGPGCLSVGDSKFAHLFDASAVLHRFCIETGTITYQRRFLRTNTFIKNQIAQRIVVTEFGTRAVPDPCKTIFQKFGAFFQSDDVSDNCMISVYPFRDELFTFGELPTIYRIDPDTLDTMYSVNASKYVNIVHHTSHPHVMEDGTVYNLGLSIGPAGPKYSIIHFPHTKKEGSTTDDVFKEAKIIAKIGTRWPFHPGYMHTFGVTTNYFLIVEQPLCVSVPDKLLQKFNDKPMSSMLKWYSSHPTIIYVVSRNTGKVTNTFYAEAFFYLHIINQYEDRDHIIVDICLYKNPSMIDCMLIEALRDAQANPHYATMFRGRPFRYVLPLKTKKTEENQVTLPDVKAKAFWTSDGHIYVIPELLCDLGCETPRINYPLHLGVKYRYFYAISSDVDLENPGTLIKVDTETKTKKTWTEKGTFPSEPIFVPSPEQKDEDDGVILSTLLWSSQPNKVAIVILDARSFTEISRTEFITQGPVPKCLHGWFTSTYS